MVKFILVESDDDPDYGAELFEDSDISVQEIYNEMDYGKLTRLTKLIEGSEVIFKLFEFEEVDPKFEEFIIYEFLDRDILNSKNFYRIKE